MRIILKCDSRWVSRLFVCAYSRVLNMQRLTSTCRQIHVYLQMNSWALTVVLLATYYFGGCGIWPRHTFLDVHKPTKCAMNNGQQMVCSQYPLLIVKASFLSMKCHVLFWENILAHTLRLNRASKALWSAISVKGWSLFKYELLD